MGYTPRTSAHVRKIIKMRYFLCLNYYFHVFSMHRSICLLVLFCFLLPSQNWSRIFLFDLILLRCTVMTIFKASFPWNWFHPKHIWEKNLRPAPGMLWYGTEIEDTIPITHLVLSKLMSPREKHFMSIQKHAWVLQQSQHQDTMCKLCR